MSQAPLYGENAQVQVANFHAPAEARQAVSFDRVQAALGRWQHRAQEEMEARAHETQARLGTVEQEALPHGEVATPPDVARRFQATYRDRAYKIFDQRMTLHASQTALKLRHEHADNPAGFASAWEAYVEGEVQGVMAQDPALAVAARRSLEAHGQDVYAQLAERRYQNDRRAQTAEALEALEAQRSVWADEVKRSGQEEDLKDANDHLRGEVNNLMEMGIITPAEAIQLRDAHSRSLTTDWLKGDFRRKLDRGDLGGGQAIIDSLYSGKWFRDNEEGERLGRALAHELAALQQEAQAQTELDVSSALRELGKYDTALASGLAIAPGRYNQLVELVAREGTRLQQYQAAEHAQSYDALAYLGSHAARLTLAELGAAQQAVHENQVQFTPSGLSAMKQALTQREADLESGLVNGDFIPGNAAFPDLLGVSHEDAATRRAESARAYNLPISAVPTWSRDEHRRFGLQIDSALKNQRLEEVDALLSAYVGAYGADQQAALQGALELGEDNGGVALPLLLHALGEGPDTATDMLRYAGTGRRADRAAVLASFSADPQDVLGQTSMRRLVSAAAMGDPDKQLDYNAFLTDVYVGALASAGEAEGSGARRFAEQEVFRGMQGFATNIRMDNGVRVPAGVLGGTQQDVQERRDQLNRLIENPSEINPAYTPAMTEDFRRNLSPRPTDGGGVGLWHNMQGDYLRKPDGTVFTIEGPEGIAEPYTPDPSRFSKVLTDVLGWAGAKAESASHLVGSQQAMVTAKRHGADPDMMRGIFYASKDTTAEERGPRGALALPDLVPTNAAAIAKQMHKDNPGLRVAVEDITPDNAGARAYIAADILKQGAKAFPNDRAAQAAAYFTSIEHVKEAQREHGDGWLTEQPMNVQAFVKRTLRHAEGK